MKHDFGEGPVIGDARCKNCRKWNSELQSAECVGVMTIEVFRGLVSDVKGLPEGWTYKVVDHDVEEVQ